MITDSQFNKVSQNAHVLAGLAWIWGSVVLFGPQYIWYFLDAGVLLAAVKEFWWDYRFENTEVRGSSMEDFNVYCMGLIIAIASYFAKLWLMK